MQVLVSTVLATVDGSIKDGRMKAYLDSVLCGRNLHSMGVNRWVHSSGPCCCHLLEASRRLTWCILPAATP